MVRWRLMVPGRGERSDNLVGAHNINLLADIFSAPMAGISWSWQEYPLRGTYQVSIHLFVEPPAIAGIQWRLQDGCTILSPSAAPFSLLASGLTSHALCYDLNT